MAFKNTETKIEVENFNLKEKRKKEGNEYAALKIKTKV